MKKFGNATEKVKVILSVFRYGEKLQGKDIVERVKRQGYEIREQHLRMFIYYHMLYKHLKKEEVEGVNHYFLLS